MFLLSNLTKRVTATSLLVVFLNVFVGQCLCAQFGIMARAERAVAAQPVSKPTHPGCHGHAAKKAAPGKQHHAAKSHGSSKGHDCCKNKSAKVLKGLTAPPTAKPTAEASLPLALPPVQDFEFAKFAAWDAAQAVVLVPPQHLPPKIPDIRIFVGSLTI